MRTVLIASVLACALACSEPAQDVTEATGGSAGSFGAGGSGAGGGAGSGGSSGAQVVTAPPGEFVGPTTLSASGLYADIDARTLADDIVEYDVRYPLWSDGSTKRRYLLIPPGASIETADMDAWRFPIGTSAWKEFWVGGKPVETRLIRKLSDAPDGWQYIAYRWRPDGSDADAVPMGEVDAAGTGHDIPSRDGCYDCHAGARDLLLGVSAVQLSPADVAALDAAGKFSETPPAFAVPGSEATAAALGYLHANCGHCHVDSHFLQDKYALRMQLRVGDAAPEQTLLYETAIGAPTKHDFEGTVVSVAPGLPAKSQIYVRNSNRDLGSMPPVGTERVDMVGLAAVKAWIESLPGD